MKAVVSGSFFLATRTLKNRVLFSLKRLKRPRYLFSAIITIIYFYMMFTRNRGIQKVRNIGPHGAFDVSGAAGVEMLTIGIAVVLFFVMLLPWLWPGSRAGLELSEPEIQFLFPAPFTRAHLMFYKWIRNLVGLTITAFVLRYFSGASSFLGTLIVMIALDAYFTFVKVSRARLRLAGVPWLGRVVVALLVGAGTIWLMWTKLLESLGGANYNAKTVLAAMQQHLLELPTGIALAVPYVFASSTTTRDPAMHAVYMAGTIGIAFVFFFLATRIDYDFEESSIEASKKKAEKVAQMRGKGAVRIVARKMPAPFKLVPQGHPAVAIFWKNLIAAGRLNLAAAALIPLALIPLILLSALKKGTGHEVLAVYGVLLLIFAAMLSVAGASMFRHDLRSDLDRVDLLRSFPLPGPSLVAAEIAAPSIIVSAVQLLMVIAGGLLLVASKNSFDWHRFGQLLSLAFLIGIPVNVAQVAIQNAWAVLLPGWSFIGKDETRGFASTGQGILILLGQLLLLMAVLLVPGIVFFVSIFAARTFGVSAENAFALALIAPSAIIVTELYGVTQWLGAKFEDLDLANDDLAPR